MSAGQQAGSDLTGQECRSAWLTCEAWGCSASRDADATCAVRPIAVARMLALFGRTEALMAKNAAETIMKV
jgi:hypothetical protein